MCLKNSWWAGGEAENVPEAWPSGFFHRTLFQTLISKITQSQTKQKIGKTWRALYATPRTLFFSKSFWNWSPWQPGKWDENLQELEEHYGWGQSRMGLLGASQLTLFWGDLREPWRPRQSKGTLTMQECVPVFSDLGFFQGNMEIEILCEVLWCFLSLRSIQLKPESCEGWRSTHASHIEAPEQHCADSDRLSSWLGAMSALGTLIVRKEKLLCTCFDFSRRS